MIDLIDKHPVITFVIIVGCLGISYNVAKAYSEANELERIKIRTADSIANRKKLLEKQWGANYEFRVDSANKEAEKRRIELTYSKKAIKLHNKHLDWSYDDCESLVKNKVWIGMSKEMLYVLRGKPDRVHTSNYGRGNDYQMVWDDYTIRCFYCKEDGIIYAYN